MLQGAPVSGRVQARTGVIPHCDLENRDDEADDEGIHALARRRIHVVTQRQDRDHEDGGGDELAEERRPRADPRLRNCKKRAACPRGRKSRVKPPYRVVEDGKRGGRGAQVPQQLEDDIDDAVTPRKPAVQSEGDADGRIEMRAADSACDVDPDHGAQTPGEAAREESAGGVGGDHLGEGACEADVG